MCNIGGQRSDRRRKRREKKYVVMRMDDDAHWYDFARRSAYGSEKVRNKKKMSLQVHKVRMLTRLNERLLVRFTIVCELGAIAN